MTGSWSAVISYFYVFRKKTASMATGGEQFLFLPILYPPLNNEVRRLFLVCRGLLTWTHQLCCTLGTLGHTVPHCCDSALTSWVMLHAFLHAPCLFLKNHQVLFVSPLDWAFYLLCNASATVAVCGLHDMPVKIYQDLIYFPF